MSGWHSPVVAFDPYHAAIAAPRVIRPVGASVRGASYDVKRKIAECAPERRTLTAYGRQAPEPPKLVDAEAVTGVDLGLEHLAVTSDGEKVENPPLQQAGEEKPAAEAEVAVKEGERLGEPRQGARPCRKSA